MTITWTNSWVWFSFPLVLSSTTILVESYSNIFIGVLQSCHELQASSSTIIVISADLTCPILGVNSGSITKLLLEFSVTRVDMILATFIWCFSRNNITIIAEHWCMWYSCCKLCVCPKRKSCISFLWLSMLLLFYGGHVSGIIIVIASLRNQLFATVNIGFLIFKNCVDRKVQHFKYWAFISMLCVGNKQVNLFNW